MGSPRSKSLFGWLLVAASVPCALHAQGAILPPPLELRVPKPPTLAAAEGGSFLAYELHLTNFSAQALTLKRVEVLTTDATPQVLLSLSDSLLLRSLARPGTGPAAERPKLGGGYRAVIYLWVPVGGRFAFYAHLQPGSLKVRLGQRVRRGQVLGLVGNSGNSTEPHLHFHLSDANSPLGSEGIPYGYAAFELVGRCAAFGRGCQRGDPAPRRAEIPLQNMLLRFPN